jgi:hypothetical protein
MTYANFAALLSGPDSLERSLFSETIEEKRIIAMLFGSFSSGPKRFSTRET